MAFKGFGRCSAALSLLVLHNLLRDVASNLLDPCISEGHRVLDDPRRSPDFRSPSAHELLCDRTLEIGWYRFRMNGTSARMTTTCAPVNHCGTQAPIWLSLGDKSLPGVGEERHLTACTTWSFPGQQEPVCCIFRSSVKIRNCGPFFIYYLRPTQGCHMAYCAVAENSKTAECAKTKNCDVNVADELVMSPVTKPRIQPSLVNNTVHLLCYFGSDHHQLAPHDKAFTVIWYKVLSPDGSRILLRTVYDVLELQDSISVSDFLHLGDNVVCEVHVYQEASNSVQNTTFMSDPFYLGIKVEPQTLQLSENGQEEKVRFSLTVPILCSDQDNECAIVVKLRARVTDPTHHFSEIVLSSCNVVLRGGPCETDCDSAEVTVTAVQDFIADGNTRSLIETTLTGTSNSLWTGYDISDVIVKVTDVLSGWCYSFTDPHFLTFDKKRFDYYGTGTFTLYKSTVRPFEVHSRIWQCHSFPALVSCNCGFAARENDDVVSVDMCNRDTHGVKPIVSILSLSGGNPNAKLLQSKNGEILTALFPSGSVVRAYVNSWGLSLIVQVPSTDFGHTRGLCGVFDGNPNNDFHDVDGVPIYLASEFGQVDEFVNIWRIPTGESLFDKRPPPLNEKNTRFCECYQPTPGDLITNDVNNLDSGYFVPLLNPDVKCDGTACQPTCGIFQNIRNQQLLHFEDVTDNAIPSNDHQTDMPGHASPTNESYVFIGDTNSFDFNPVVPRYPTPGGLSELDIENLCRLALQNSTTAKHCASRIGKSLELAIAMCVLDVTLTDNSSWASFIIPFVESTCEEAVLQSRSRWSPDDEVQIASIISALNCPNGCNAHGQCRRNLCHCDAGYNGKDCSFSEGIAIPTIFSVGDDSLCDVTKSTCLETLVQGENFQNHPSLSCMIKKTQFTDGGLVAAEEVGISPAEFLDPHRVKCRLPHISNAIGGPEISWQIKVSNDNVRFSKSASLTVYNSSCQRCLREEPCVPQPYVCIIDGKCYGEDQPNPVNECDVCQSQTHPDKWAPNPRNMVPIFQIPQQSQLKVLEGQEFVYPLKAFDPEGGPIRFTLHRAVPGAQLTTNGELRWKSRTSYSKKMERFRIVMADQCNLTTTYELEVEVVFCSCKNGENCSVAEDGNKMCLCPKNFTGKFCELRVDPCADRPCLHGFCSANGSRFICRCPPGYRGELCEHPVQIDHCSSNPCFSGVECFSVLDTFICGTCPVGLTGNGINCTDAFPCGNLGPCFPGVRCQINELGITRCGDCPSGFKGNGTSCKAVCNVGCSGINQICVRPDVCQCRPGHTGNFCNIPICERGCVNGGLCIKTSTCKCPYGFTGKRCEIGICKPQCFNGGRCLGRNICVCQSGYNGKACERVSCSYNCQNGGTCLPMNQCECPKGWSGPRCDVAQCTPPCQNGGTCVYPGSCLCPPYFYGQDCSSSLCFHPCRNGGKCVSLNHCSCPDGWEGPHCQKPICSHGCINGGKCLKPDRCYCNSGWQGSTCQSPICVNKCENGGTCVQPEICACLPGYSGLQCQKPICKKKCLNGGRCIEPGLCKCPPGFTGNNCSVKPPIRRYTRHERHRSYG